MIFYQVLVNMQRGSVQKFIQINVQFYHSCYSKFVPSYLSLVEKRGNHDMYTVHALSWTAGLRWAAIGWPWSCNLRANSYWKEASQTGSQAAKAAPNEPNMNLRPPYKRQTKLQSIKNSEPRPCFAYPPSTCRHTSPPKNSIFT